jgi:hypothetical protein
MNKFVLIIVITVSLIGFFALAAIGTLFYSYMKSRGRVDNNPQHDRQQHGQGHPLAAVQGIPTASCCDRDNWQGDWHHESCRHQR